MPLAKPLTIVEINYVHEWFVYEEMSPSGLLYRKSRGRRIKKGEIAGSFDRHNKYWHVRTSTRLIKCHRAVWLLCGGIELPPWLSIDHINRDSRDNRFFNLRPATRSQQALNQRHRRPIL